MTYLYDSLDRTKEVRHPARYGISGNPRKIIERESINIGATGARPGRFTVYVDTPFRITIGSLMFRFVLSSHEEA